MPFSIAPDPYGANVGTGGLLGSGLAQSLTQGMQRMLDQQAEQQLYNLGLKRQEQQYKSQVGQLAPFLKGLNLPEGFADLLVRQPQFAQQILKGQQAEQAGLRESNLFNALMGQGSQSQQTETGGISGIPKSAMGTNAPKDNIQLPAGTQLKPGDALKYANYLKQLEQQNTANALRQKQIDDATQRFQQTQAFKAQAEANKTGLGKGRIEETQQKTITGQNKQFNERLDNEIAAKGKIQANLGVIENALKTGKVSSGPSGYIPFGLQNKESQDVQQAAGEIATLIADATPGGATDIRLKTVLGNKLNLTQTTEGQKEWVNRQKKLLKLIDVYQDARADIIKNNRGKQPANLQQLVEEKVKPKKEKIIESIWQDYNNQQDKILRSVPDTSQLPSAATYKGKGFNELDDSGNPTGRKIIVKNGQWKYA